MADIFISYSQEDTDVVGGVAAALEQAGYSTWYYTRDSDLAEDYLKEIGDELSRCRAVVFVISDQALDSSEVYSELVEAHRLGRVKVPLLRGITHEQMRQRSAKWAIALGGAVGAPLPPAGWDYDALADRIVKGLRKQGLQPPNSADESAPSPVHQRHEPKVRAAPARTRGPAPTHDDTPLGQPGERVGETATGPDGGAYVWVPAGEFDMGAAGLGQPVHHVRITKGFWLGKCTVTLGQWKAYCQKAGIEVGKATAPSDNHPVVFVSWDDAKAYCKHSGLDLPTEAQWEYAARGPKSRMYPWGNQWDPKKCCNDQNKGPDGTTFPVGSFPEGASWCGALDMVGNVWEWCNDWYDNKYYYANSPVDDPSGPDSGQWRSRSLRGGSWDLVARYCRSSFRRNFVPTTRNDNIGFRASRTP